jgi:hypothetical protein
MEENTNFIIYHNPNGEVKVDVFVEGETVWLTQKSMGELFGVVKSTISEHLSNIFETNEISNGIKTISTASNKRPFIVFGASARNQRRERCFL